MYGRRGSLWQRIKQFMGSLWDWCCDLFEPEQTLEEQYETKVNELAAHMGTYITQHEAIEKQTFDPPTRMMVEKHNAALSLLATIHPEARFRGKKIKIDDDRRLTQQRSTLTQTVRGVRHRDQVERDQRHPVTEWVRQHQIGAKYEARDLNYHRNAFGRFFQSILGTSLVKTKTMRLIDDAIELEQFR
jgi:hypothetical protein